MSDESKYEELRVQLARLFECDVEDLMREA